MQYTYVLFVQIFGDKKNNLYKIVELEEPNMDQILQKNEFIQQILCNLNTYISANLTQIFFSSL